MDSTREQFLTTAEAVKSRLEPQVLGRSLPPGGLRETETMGWDSPGDVAVAVELCVPENPREAASWHLWSVRMRELPAPGSDGPMESFHRWLDDFIDTGELDRIFD